MSVAAIVILEILIIGIFKNGVLNAVSGYDILLSQTIKPITILLRERRGAEKVGRAMSVGYLLVLNAGML